ncbi:S8 family peptidase [Arenimonas oryziterrae]|uniref:Calx-beta domain-containing protein n=1 Tax=Arenimonas oryziterrae DSM 21050 = YC6267 TaxID=1121015 RepID=A0A091APF7_9GAMM|nr:S8 family serine peptidase [Arenimonas oryziterrae]KFN41002.1 hypothetical protein N789_03730 [Arenimonas oryziterrae DSM 21050 = YC6267]
MSAGLSRIVAVLCLLLVAWTAQAADVVSPQTVEAVRAQGRLRVLVALRDAPATDKLTALPTAKGDAGLIRRLQVKARVDAVLAALPLRSYTLRRRFVLVPAFALDVDLATLRRLQSDPAVLRIDPDVPGRGHADPDAASVLNAVSPLQSLGLDGTGMKVAVIDSGVDTDHSDLHARLVSQQCFCSNSSGIGGCCPNGQATMGGYGSAEDNNGHGTNVSGIILGEGNVAPRGALPHAQLVAVKVLDANNSFCCSSDVVAAMDWVATNHPDVDAVNLSLGTGANFAGDCDTATAYTIALATAVNSLISKGAVVTVSSGNQANSNGMSAPACVSTAMSVGATWDFTGGSVTFLSCTEASTAPKKPTCFTNRSTTTDIYGAGAFVTSAGHTGGTSTYGGTSQAAPMVAACAAALKQAMPASTVTQRIDAMKLAPTTVFDPVSARNYPFIDCVDALRILDGRPALTVYDMEVLEGNIGGQPTNFTIGLSAPAPPGGVSFNIATADTDANNGAIAGRDYGAVQQLGLVIPAGQTTATFSVKVYGDSQVEADEVFRVQVSNVLGARIARGEGMGKIDNDDTSATRTQRPSDL